MEKSRYFELSGEILDPSIKVHKTMGPGLLESVYQFCLLKELRNRRILVEADCQIPLVYKDEILPKAYRMDMLVEKEIIIELKSVEIILPVHEAQMISYLKLSKKKLGLLINFNVPLIKMDLKDL